MQCSTFVHGVSIADQDSGRQMDRTAQAACVADSLRSWSYGLLEAPRFSVHIQITTRIDLKHESAYKGTSVVLSKKKEHGAEQVLIRARSAWWR